MLLVGLTGGIGSGKSTVSNLLGNKGAVVIDADAIVRELQQAGTPVFGAIVEHFGTEIVGPDGELDRPALADRVFGDADSLAALNAIVHPAVGAEIARRMEEVTHLPLVVVLDVPLLVESGRDDMEELIVVDLDPDVAVQRAVEHRGMRAEDVRARIARQVSREARLAKATVVIDNSGSFDELEDRVEEVWIDLESRLPEWPED